MAERKTRKGRAVTPAKVRARESDEAERSLGRAVSLGLPLLCVVAAVVVGVVASLGSALLVLASGALLGTIALLWASVRTLSGDGVDELAEQKTRVLRALKDLETEHALGKIDDADYGSIVTRYRDEAKAVMRQMDLEVAPLREEAERVARDYLERRGVAAAVVEAVAPGEATPIDARPVCTSCRTSNDPDAAFCKKCGSAMKDASAEKTDAEE
jgi:hypothetical protein